MSEFGGGGIALTLKIGGAQGLDLAAIARDIARLPQPPIIVHGLSGAMARLTAARGREERMLESPSGHRYRHTDAATRDLLVEAAALAGAEVATALREAGIRVEPLQTPLALRARRKTAIRALVAGRQRVIRDDYSGVIERVDAARLREVLAAGAAPLLPPLADSDDGPLNIDGDRAAAAVAVALRAGGLLILSNVRGLYRRFPDERTLARELRRGELTAALAWAQGRMKRKVLSAQEALAGGVAWARIADGRRPQPITDALAGAGTCFRP